MASWIWSYESQTFGLAVHPDTGALTWHAGIGDLCGDDDGFARQTPAEFVRCGAPARVGPLSDEVAAGLRRALDEVFMRRCLRLARASAEAGEAAVGSLIVRGGVIVGEGREATRQRRDPAAHAEVEAVRASLQSVNAEAIEYADLSEATLYTTVEPCFMCAYVIREVRIRRVVVGTMAGEIGAICSEYPLLRDETIQRWGCPPEIVSGVLGERCRQLLGGR